jgi:glycosyltransferase involved in cell wall biosynthesis
LSSSVTDSGGQPSALRVVHLVSSSTFAGIERHVLHLSSELRALECRAEIACPPAARRLREEAGAAGIPVLPSASVRQRTWMGAAARRLLGDPPAVLHVHDGRGAVLGALLCGVMPSRLIRTQHFSRPATMERAGWARRGSLALHRGLAHRLDAYTGVSRCVVEGGRERGEVGRGEAAVIPPSIILPAEQAVSDAHRSRARLAAPVAVFAGRLEAERRLDVLLHAVPRVRAQLPDCRFVLAGVGEAEPELRAQAQSLGVQEAITWPGWLEDPYSMMGQGHVYVNPWPWEGFGMAMAEAMALEMPVIAVDSGASSEMVEHGVTGLLVAPNDSEALSAALLRLLSDLPHTEMLGRAARRRAVSLYSAHQSTRATRALYGRVSAGPAQ